MSKQPRSCPSGKGAIISGSCVGWTARPVGTFCTVLRIVHCENYPPYKSVVVPVLERLCSVGSILCSCATKIIHLAVVFVACFCFVFLFVMDFSDSFEPISFHGELLVPYGSQETALVSPETVKEEGEPVKGPRHCRSASKQNCASSVSSTSKKLKVDEANEGVEKSNRDNEEE